MLRRIRIGFAVLALLLLAPLGFLIGRTLDTLDRERELQHAAVANRVFDEAEGALADFLREEQARPADAYRRWPSGAEWMASRPPFVQAYFQIDHLGSVRTSAAEPELESALRASLEPARPADPGRLESRGNRAAGAAADSREAATRSERVVASVTATPDSPGSESPPGERTLLETRAPKREQKKEKKDGAPAPGTARNVQSIDLITGRAKAGKADAPEAEGDDEASYSSSRALETLGRIAKVTAREEAAPRAALDSYAPSATFTDDASGDAKREAGQDRDTALRARVPAALAQPDTLELEEAEPIVIAEQLVAESGAAPARTAARRAPLALAPSRLSGERIDDAHLLLYRTALDDEGHAARQGMLVSVDALGAWLTGRVLGESELRDSLDLELLAASAPIPEPLPADRYVYAYRFAEPFEMLSLQLALSPLDDGGNARNIGWLSALLIAASTLGLYAVYRMAAVAVHFAERRSNFAAAVSHELKTPLTAIRMYGEMLRDGMVPDEAKRNDYYRTITSESERLTRLIDNVLEWSRLEKHQREATLVTADPSEAVREIVQVVGPHAEAQGFEIELRLAPALPPVRHDPDALQQILYNLIDNAIKYARGHEPARIEVEAAPAAEGGVTIRVRDHGPGVAPEKLPLVFEAFYRGEDELTRETKGTGIGLALARALADSMRGRLVPRNHPDGGLEVELRLVAS